MTYRLLKFACPGLLILFLWGCVRYHPKPISPESALDDFEARRLDSPELKNHLLASQAVKEWPPLSWDLKSLTLAAFYYHPDLDVARAQWGVAGAGRVTAGERPNPTANPSLGYNSSTPLDTITRWIPDIILSIPIETAGKRGIRIAQARQVSEAARWNIFSVAWEVRSRVRRTLLDLYRAEEMESLLTKQLDIQTENLRLLELQLAAGEVAGYDVTQARIALGTSRLAALDASGQKAEARVHLADALGIPVKALDGVAISFEAFQRPPSDIPQGDVRRKALLNRADILGALADYAAVEAALKLEIARQYPDIDLNFGYQLDQTDNKWTLGLASLLPLLNRNKGPIAEAEAKRRESGARFLNLQAKAIGDLDAAIAACRTAGENSKTVDALLADLKRQEETAGVKWQYGEISKLEYFGVQLEWSASALARLDTLLKAQEALGRLEDAMQSPLELGEWIVETPRNDSGYAKEHKDE